MRTFRRSLSLMLFVLLAVNNYAEDKAASPSFELKVSELKDSNLFPGAKGYSATLTNTTSKAIPLEPFGTGSIHAGIFGRGDFLSLRCAIVELES